MEIHVCHENKKPNYSNSSCFTMFVLVIGSFYKVCSSNFWTWRSILTVFVLKCAVNAYFNKFLCRKWHENHHFIPDTDGMQLWTGFKRGWVWTCKQLRVREPFRSIHWPLNNWSTYWNNWESYVSTRNVQFTVNFATVHKLWTIS